MKGKLLTIAGIVLIFGYFISESVRNTYDPTQVVMVGEDTLGRDWGAIAEQKMKEIQTRNELAQGNEGTGISLTDKGKSDEVKTISSEDPFQKQKFNQDNYSTIQDENGMEVIIGYDRPEQQESENPYETRHQREKGRRTGNVDDDETPAEEPSIIYRQ